MSCILMEELCVFLGPSFEPAIGCRQCLCQRCLGTERRPWEGAELTRPGLSLGWSMVVTEARAHKTLIMALFADMDEGGLSGSYMICLGYSPPPPVRILYNMLSVG